MNDFDRMGSTPLTPQLIAQLDNSTLDDCVWMRLSSLYNLGDAEALVEAPPAVRAYLATRLFEWEVGNGGLHQYFFNYPDPDLFKLVLEGYSHLGLLEARHIIEDIVAPIAEREHEWRESLRDGTIETFFESYPESELTEFDALIEEHDAKRVDYVRANPALFCV